MKKLVVIATVLCAIMAVGCSKKAADRGYDVYIFNAKGENAAQVEAMAKAYQAETGVRVKTFSIGAGAEQEGPLTTEMNSKNPPSIYSIQGIKRLQAWLDGGFVVDLATVTDPPEFATLVADIPLDMRMALGGNTSYGIPYNIEGYGYIVDKQMIADLFGPANGEAALAGLQAANYAEWEAFVIALDSWIQSPAPAMVPLGGQPFTLAAEKTELTSKLNGVFVMMGAEAWTIGDHLVNFPLDATFSTLAEALRPSKEKVEDLRNPLIAYAKALDLKSSHLAGKNGPAQRGQDLVSPSNFGYDQTVQIFIEGKALFLKQGNWAYNNIAAVNKDMAERLWFIPVKMPFTQADISAQGLTPEKFNTSIPVFVPNYYAVNATVSDEEKLAAYKFLLWMNTSATGQRYIVEEMAFIPYNADPATTTVPNSLGNSILDYVKYGNTLPGMFQAVPSPWPGDIFGAYVREHYLVKPVWTEADYADIADFGVKELIKSYGY
jgi:raffinose/stachyose/melibiose transport system substrate-binding protein